jgi:hypothetical protein
VRRQRAKGKWETGGWRPELRKQKGKRAEGKREMVMDIHSTIKAKLSHRDSSFLSPDFFPSLRSPVSCMLSHVSHFTSAVCPLPSAVFSIKRPQKALVYGIINLGPIQTDVIDEGSYG